MHVGRVAQSLVGVQRFARMMQRPGAGRKARWFRHGCAAAATEDSNYSSAGDFNCSDVGESVALRMLGSFKITKVAHVLWQGVLKTGDTAVDATVGNGHDTLVLCGLCLGPGGEGRVVGLDRQARAIESTRQKLEGAAVVQGKWGMTQVELFEMCHSQIGMLGEGRPILESGDVKLICYNLGHLPGVGDEERGRTETQVGTTLESLRRSLDLLADGGLISVMCYSHEAGVVEKDALVAFAASLERSKYSVMQFTNVNAKSAPTLVCIYKRMPGG